MTYHFAVIEREEYAENPRNEWEQMGTLYTWHSRYTLGGKDDLNNVSPIQNLQVWAFDQFNELAKSSELDGYHSYDDEMYFNDEDLTVDQFTHFKTFVDQWLEQNLCILPVYMYDHSGITISTGPFHCPWDSGQVGVIYMTKQRYETETQKIFNQEDARKILQSEIETLDNYLTGDVWGYTIYETEDEDFDGEILEEDAERPEECEAVDSCCGYYGFSHIEDEVKNLLNTYQKELET